MKTLSFHFDLISPYAYLAFEALPQALEGCSYVVDYRPALLAGFPAMLGRMARRRNSLRSLRSLRSDICAKSVIDARCARGPSRLRFSAPPKGDGASPDDPWRGRLVVVAGSSCASLRLPLPRGGRGRNPKTSAAIC